MLTIQPNQGCQFNNYTMTLNQKYIIPKEWDYRDKYI